MVAVVTGGSGSGKSEYAEGLAVSLAAPDGKKIYLATMRPWDEECRQKIEKHRRMRAKKQFETWEWYTDLDHFPAKAVENSVVLLECMSNLVSNEYYGYPKADTAEKVAKGICRLAGHSRHLVVVTNDVFGDGVIYEKETARYMEILGQVNRYLAQLADTMTEVVYSVPVSVYPK